MFGEGLSQTLTDALGDIAKHIPELSQGIEKIFPENWLRSRRNSRSTFGSVVDHPRTETISLSGDPLQI